MIQPPAGGPLRDEREAVIVRLVQLTTAAEAWEPASIRLSHRSGAARVHVALVQIGLSTLQGRRRVRVRAVPMRAVRMRAVRMRVVRVRVVRMRVVGVSCRLVGMMRVRAVRVRVVGMS